MVENSQGTSKRQHGTGKPRISSRIAPRFSIGVQFVSFVVLVALLAGGIVGYSLINTSRGSLRQEVLHNNLAQADLAADFASNYMKVIQASIRSFALRPTVMKAILENEPERIQSELTQFIEIQTMLASGAFTDEKSIQRVFSQTGVTTIGQSFADRDWFQQPAATLQPYQGVAVKSRASGLLVAPYGVPILDGEGKFRGVVSAGISLAALSDALVKVYYDIDTNASIIDSRNSGIIVAHVDPELLMTQVSEKNEAINRLMARERGSIEVMNSTWEMDLVGFAPVPDLPWGVMVTTPSKSAFAVVNTLTKDAGLFTGFIVLLAAFFGVVLMFGVTRPLLRLVEGTKEIGSGNLDYKVVTTGRDEIGDLSRAFGQMVQQLKQTLVSRDELAKEVAEREKTEAELLQSEEKYRSLFENSQVGMYRSRLDGSAILDVNKKLCEIFGYSREEMLTNPATIRWADPKARQEMMSQLKGKGVLTDYEINVVTKSGEIKPCLVSVKLFPKDGYLEGSAIDITERKRAEEKLREYQEHLEELVKERTVELTKANNDLSVEIEERKLAEEQIKSLNEQLQQRVAQLEASNKELDAFSYSVSHDLRAPLRSIDGFSQILIESYGDKLTGESKDYLQRVRTASQHMGRLIDDLLRLSRVSRSEIRFETVNLSNLVKSIADELHKTQPRRRVDFVIAPDLTASGDARLLRIMLENLLDNAWKFTGSRPNARIEFGMKEYEGKQAFFISDDGAGFDMTYVDKLFQPFQRLHSLAEFPGSGIGLAIASRVINRHGGSIRATGVVDKGTTFYFTL
jgi:PAS domain S-box-containing protein